MSGTQQKACAARATHSNASPLCHRTRSDAARKAVQQAQAKLSTLLADRKASTKRLDRLTRQNTSRAVNPEAAGRGAMCVFVCLFVSLVGGVRAAGVEPAARLVVGGGGAAAECAAAARPRSARRRRRAREARPPAP